MNWMLMPFRRYAEFTGRSRRTEFWMWKLFLFLVGVAFGVVIFALAGASIMALVANAGNPAAVSAGAMAALGVGGIFYLLLLLFSLAVIIPDLAVTVRRLHDTNRTGWWILAPLAGVVVVFLGAAANSSALSLLGSLLYIVAAIALFVFLVLDGTPGPNRYGPDPKLRDGFGTGVVEGYGAPGRVDLDKATY